MKLQFGRQNHLCYTNMDLLFLKDPNIQSQSDTYVPNIYVSVGNDSIKAVTKNLTWNDAKKSCEADKATLASFRNEWSQAYVELLVLNLKAPVWIGLNKNQVLLHNINTSCLQFEENRP